MVEFDLWKEAFILGLVFTPIVTIPCVLVGIMGRKMIDQLGRFPTNTPVIQMSILAKLILIEIITFVCLMAFFQYFSSGKA